MDDEDNLPTLGDFFFQCTGDETIYNEALEVLFICYTLTRGLQAGGSNPRRPAIPLELILRIIRLAGYTDANPDPTLTLNVDVPHTPPGYPNIQIFTSSNLSHTHLISMARIHLVPLDKTGLSRFPRDYQVSFS